MFELQISLSKSVYLVYGCGVKMIAQALARLVRVAVRMRFLETHSDCNTREQRSFTDTVKTEKALSILNEPTKEIMVVNLYCCQNDKENGSEL